MLQMKSNHKKIQEYIKGRPKRDRVAVNDTVLRINSDGTESIGIIKSIVKKSSILGMTEVVVEWGRFQWNEDAETSIIKRVQLTWRDSRQAWTFLD